MLSVNAARHHEEFSKRIGKISVCLSTCCADDGVGGVNTFCLDVSEIAKGECLDNEHVDSSLPLTATKKEIDAYLSAALKAARESFGRNPRVKYCTNAADAAGAAAAVAAG